MLIRGQCCHHITASSILLRQSQLGHLQTVGVVEHVQNESDQDLEGNNLWWDKTNVILIWKGTNRLLFL